MRIERVHLMIALCSALLVFSLALVDAERTSPGPLSAVHGLDPEIQSESCAVCHGGWFESMTSACLECHDEVQGQVDLGAGLHGNAPSAIALDCGRCHGEHHGEEFRLVNAVSFAAAGTTGPEDFDHSFIGFPMAGRHLELSCNECHENADAAVLPAGEFRFMGLDASCASCHEDPHEGAMAMDCADCHGQTAWDEYVAPGHDEVLPLLGGHADVACSECHEAGSPRALEVMGGHAARFATRACAECHGDPHAEAFVRGSARLVGTPVDESCGVCHEADHETFAGSGATVTGEAHAMSGFLLELPHEEVSCEDCHEPDALFEERFPGRVADDCAACHEDPHDGQFEEGPFAAEGCVACHGRHRFEPHAFDLELHERATLALEGQHAEIACEACHESPGEDLPRKFRGTSDTCSDCHDDAHDGFFEHHGSELSAVLHGACAACHDAGSFGAARGDFEHERWTGFDVAGAHAQGRCETCHIPAEEPDLAGRVFGRAEEHFGAYQDCSSCHADPHDGAFDRNSSLAVFEESEGCARCHDEVSFRSAAETFDHGLWTGFVLSGTHASSSCTSCHARVHPPTDAGRTWGRALGAECGDCHASPHAGQFRDLPEEPADCSRCHRPADAFTQLRFDHDRDSDFPLHEAHEALACDRCHDAWTLEDGSEVTRYAPLPTGCDSCHASPREDPRGGFRRRPGR
jgi:hypothetical protein